MKNITDNIDLLITTINNEVFKVNEKRYYLGDYFKLDLSDIYSGRYEIVYKKDMIPDRYLRTNFIIQLFKTLNDFKIIPAEILYYMPDNKCTPEYYAYIVPLIQSSLEKIPINDNLDYLEFNLTKKSYINFYDMFYHKIPILDETSNYYKIYLLHCWIKKILI